ncbi:MAG: ferritin-like domain-containing protein [Acidimicrobiales bacterium]
MDDKALRRMASHVDDVHREAMRTIEDDLGEAHFGTADPALVASRRSFLRRASTAGAVIAIGGATIPVASMVPAAAQEAATAPTLNDSDTQLVRFAQSVELAAVAAYEAAVGTRLLDSAQVELASLFGRHHQEHADALGKVLPTKEVVTAPNQKLLDAVAPQITAAQNANAVLQVAYNLEAGAAATYQFAMTSLINQTVAGAAGSIEPVEAQHSVVLGQLLNVNQSEYLPPFQSQTGAFSPQTYALPTS